MRHFIIILFLMLPLAASAQPEWTSHIIVSQYTVPFSAVPVDLDGDGDQDLLTTAMGTGLHWQENTGDGWISHQLGSADAGYAYADAADVDNDGDLDVIAVAWLDGNIELLTNDGGTFVTATVYSGNLPWHVAPADLDQDGDIDLILSMYGNSQVVVLVNVDAGSVWTPQPAGNVGGPRRTAVADLDGDGDLDIAGTASQNSTVFWLENLDDVGTSWTTHVIQPFEGAYGLVLADHDDDGDVDFFATAQSLHTVGMFLNLGDGTFEYSAIGSCGFARGLAMGDIDGGPSPDLVVSGLNGEAFWLEGENNWAPHSIPGASGSSFASLADLDGDGDQDIILAEEASAQVRWWEQVGDPSPVQFDLQAQDSPVIIPPEGGSFAFDVHIVSTLNLAFPGVQEWTALELPNGQVFGPLISTIFALPPYADIWVLGASQTIPALGPPGTYRFSGHLGWQGYEQDDSFFVYKEFPNQVVPLTVPLTPADRSVLAAPVAFRADQWSASLGTITRHTLAARPGE